MKKVKKFEVHIFLNSLSYEVEANDEDEAIELAHELAVKETSHDLLSHADYECEEPEDD